METGMWGIGCRRLICACGVVHRLGDVAVGRRRWVADGVGVFQNEFTYCRTLGDVAMGRWRWVVVE